MKGRGNLVTSPIRSSAGPEASDPQNPNPTPSAQQQKGRRPARRERSKSSPITSPETLERERSRSRRGGPRMSSQVFRSASRAARRALSSAPRSSPLLSEGKAVAASTATTFRRNVSTMSSFYQSANRKSASKGWISGALAVPAAVYMLLDQEAHAAELERTFIAIKPDGVQRGLIAEIVSRFERKGYKLVAIKLVVPSKEFAQKHYHDLKERPFFNGLCDFLSSGPVLAMVWEGEGVIKYGRKLIGATDPQKSEPGTIRGDLAVVVGRNIIHGSDGPETAKDEIALWFEPSELVSYTSNAEKWIYGEN